jgi:hypothetical protein
MGFMRIAGLCFVAVFVMSMVAAGTASAAPHWLVCLPATSGSTATKWSGEQCSTTASGGSWEWSEPKTTEAVRSEGTLTLAVERPFRSTLEIKCVFRDIGWIGPNGTDQITAFNAGKCENLSGCGKLEKLEWRNFPWNSELKETEGKIYDAIRGNGTGELAWEIACKGVDEIIEIECRAERWLLALENRNTPGNLAALLVLAGFVNPNKPKENCTNGKEVGNVSGSAAILLASGRGLRVSK